MNIIEKDNSIILKNPDSFNLTHIFECGQCFRFNEVSKNCYRGVVNGRVLTITQSGDEVILKNTSFQDFKAIFEDYFDLSTDYSEIKKRLSNIAF